MSYKPAILEAATELFAERGFKNTSIAAIAKTAGAAEGTLFHHFRSKEEIFLEVLKLAKGRIINEVDETISAESLNTGLEHVEAVINTYLYLSEKLHAEFSLLSRGYSYEQAKAHAAWRNTLESIYNCFLNALSEGILIGQEDGSIASDISPPKTAMLIFAMINGLVRIGDANLFPVDSLGFAILTFGILLRNTKATRYTDEVVGELAKVTWPSKDETIKASTTVVVVTLLFSGLLGLYDLLWKNLADYFLFS